MKSTNTSTEAFPVEEIVNELSQSIADLHPEIALLFGSALENGYGAHDLDILIVSIAFDGVLWQNRRALLSLPPGPNYDLWLYTPREYSGLMQRGDPALLHAAHSGVPLGGDEAG